ncbi:MAG: M16 family metallopeptidase [Polyangiaceae bacterium]
MKLTPVAFAAAALLFAPRAFAIAPPPYLHHVCPDGLEVIVVERHATPLVTVEIAVHNGAMAESPEYNGLSHLYEHMFFTGNTVIPDQLAYSARLRELGMVHNGTTEDNRVNYFFTTTSDHFADAMVFMRDAITAPLFDKDELDRERVIVTGEMDRDESDPQFLLWRAVEQKVFWKYPSRKNSLGERKTVLATTPEKMRTIQTRYYVPNNSLLLVIGDVHADDVFKRADELYAGWLKAPDPFKKFPLVKNPAIPRSEAVVVAQPVQTFTAYMEWIGPSSIGPSADYSYAADLLGSLLSDPASKFQKDLVDSGACVGGGMIWQTARDDGAFTYFVEGAEANAETCLRAAIAELPKIKSPDYFSDAEIKNAAHHIDVGLAKEREETQSYAHQISSMWADATLDYYATYSDRLHAVTRADIAKLVDAYLLGKPFILGALESPTLAKTMDKAHLEQIAGIGAAKGAKGAKGGAK